MIEKQKNQAFDGKLGWHSIGSRWCDIEVKRQASSQNSREEIL